MPYTVFGDDDQFAPEIELPLHLKHKPIYAMPYQGFDGFYGGDTDARYLSVGLAQWDNNDLSLKVMRHTGEKWTRQAEELPLHRVFDAAIFLAKILFDNEGGRVEIDGQTFESQDAAIEILREQLSDENVKIFNDYIGQRKELLQSRLNTLYQILGDLKAKGKL
jgi:hypothetical protein